jgi:hypothetical protein
VITYRVLDLPGPGPAWTITLWIDAQTMLPLKRLLDGGAGKEGPVRITEVCNVSLEPKIEAGAFALPR